MVGLKLKRCKICREEFRPFSTLAKVCSVECAIKHNKTLRDREVRRAALQFRRENMSKGELARDAQKAFNRFIRLRDHNRPCISCGATNPGRDGRGGRWDCSHYRSVGSAPELRFEELNCHRACKYCNQFLSGNVVEYRKGLLDRIGLEKLEWLEGPHPAKRYSRQELRDLTEHYRTAAKMLEKLHLLNEAAIAN